MKLRERLRRPDWLAELQSVLVLGLLVVAGILGFGVVQRAAGRSLPVEVPASAVSGTLDYQLRAGASVAQDQVLAVTVADPSVAQRIAWALQSAPTYLVIGALLVLLLRTVWLARRGDPFTRGTARRLRVLAVVAIASGWLGFCVEAVAAMHLSSTVLADGMDVRVDLPLYWFLVGFGLFAVAEIVRRGFAMRSELDGVV